MEHQDWKSRLLPLIRDQRTGKPVTVRFAEFECQVMMERYPDGQLSLQLVDEQGGVARATTNQPDPDIAEDQVLIKDYSTNHGIFQALLDGGVVTDTGRMIETEFGDVHVAQLSQHVFEQSRAFKKQLQLGGR